MAPFEIVYHPGFLGRSEVPTLMLEDAGQRWVGQARLNLGSSDSLDLITYWLWWSQSKENS
jgi:hypothetical protein